MTSFAEEFGECFPDLDDLKERIVSCADDDTKICKHPQTMKSDGYVICKVCGMELEVCDHAMLVERETTTGTDTVCDKCGCEVAILDFKPEWRYYGDSDARSGRDPSRCHRSQESTRGGIDKVFLDAKLNIQSSIRKGTEKKYKTIVGNETVRGKGRKGIVAACLLFTFRDEGDIKTSDEVRNLFGLTKQEMSDGLTRYYAVFPNDRTRDYKPVDLVLCTMNRTGVNLSYYKYIIRIARCLEGVDPLLNHSTPQAVAAAIVYLYLCITPELRKELGYTKTKFASKVGLSDITITRLVKKAIEILGVVVDV